MTSASSVWQQSLLSGAAPQTLSKAINRSLCKTIIENAPPLTETLHVCGQLSISLGTCRRPIAITIDEHVEPSAAGAWSDSGSSRGSPLNLPGDTINSATKLFLERNGACESPKMEPPVDLTVANDITNDVTSDDSSEKDEMTCKVCQVAIGGGLGALQTHVKEEHGRVVCRFCFATFSLQCNLKRHERIHLGLRPHSCSICHRCFARSTDLNTHLSREHAAVTTSPASPVHACDQCSDKFPNHNALVWHRYRVHGADEGVVGDCVHCEEVITSADDLALHGQPSSQEDVASDAVTSPDEEVKELVMDTTVLNDDVTTESCDSNTETKVAATNGLTKLDDKMDIDATKQNNDVKAEVKPDVAVTSSRGSRKRKIGKPMRLAKTPTNEDVELDQMYFESPTDLTVKGDAAARFGLDLTSSSQFDEKRSREELVRRVLNASQSLEQQEPENLVMKPRLHTPPNPMGSSGAHLNYNMATSVVNQLAFMASQGAFKPIQTTPSQQSLLSGFNFAGGVPANLPASVAQFQSRAAPPIMITPDVFANRAKKPPETPPLNAKAAKRQKTTPGARSANPSPVSSNSKLKITSVASDVVDENKEYVCSEQGCGEVIRGFSLYEDHYMLRHGRYPCKFCPNTFSGKNNRTRHMRCHLGDRTYSCPDCNKTFSRPDSMREHQFIHTKSYQEDRCRHCGAIFDKKNLLLAHLKQCYRHKMETGKSTRFIDETPNYPTPSGLAASSSKSHVNDTKGKSSLLADPLPPLKPFKLDTIPGFKKLDASLTSSSSLVGHLPSPISSTGHASLASSVGSPGLSLLPPIDLNLSAALRAAVTSMSSNVNNLPAAASLAGRSASELVSLMTNSNQTLRPSTARGVERLIEQRGGSPLASASASPLATPAPVMPITIAPFTPLENEGVTSPMNGIESNFTQIKDKMSAGDVNKDQNANDAIDMTVKPE